MKKIPEFFTILGLIILSTCYPQGVLNDIPSIVIHIIPIVIDTSYPRPQYIHMLWITLGPYYEESIFSQNFTELSRIK
jgi:hypothetical protein